ncbi:MAG: MFS transporter [Dehalococcoidia bacterium]
MAEEVLATGQKSGRIFYGWRIVGVAFLSYMVGASGVSVSGFSVLLKPMSEDPELGWSRATLSGAFALGVVVVALLGPVLGPLLDKRHGPRSIIIGAAFLSGLGAVLVSRMDQVWQFYLFFGVLGSVGFQGSFMLIHPTIISKWFIRRRGRALAFSGMGLSMGTIIFVPLTQALISALDWRTTWAILGFIVWFVVIPLAFLFVKRRPEDIGLQPDGDEPTPKETLATYQGDGYSLEEPMWTLSAALRTQAFWLISIAFALSLMALMGVLVHQVAYLTDPQQGFSATIAVSAVVTFSVFSTLGKGIWFFLADRLHVRYSMVFTFAACAIGITLLLNVANVPLVFLWGVVYGLAISGLETLMSLLWANYYGRAFLGAIRGVSLPLNYISMALAPLLAGWLFDVTGSYDIALFLFLGAYALAAFLILMARPPNALQREPVGPAREEAAYI